MNAEAAKYKDGKGVRVLQIKRISTLLNDFRYSKK
jgi:hypothetical protein